MGLVEPGDRFPQPLARSAVEVDDGANSGRVHFGQVLRHGRLGETRGATAEMVVHVDRRKLGAVDLRHRRTQHRAWLPIAKLQLANVVPLRFFGR